MEYTKHSAHNLHCRLKILIEQQRLKAQRMIEHSYSLESKVLYSAHCSSYYCCLMLWKADCEYEGQKEEHRSSSLYMCFPSHSNSQNLIIFALIEVMEVLNYKGESL